MATVTFVLKDPKEKTETPVFMVFRVGETRVKISTNKKIKPRYWNKATRRARQVTDFNHTDFNSRLNDIEEGVINRYERHLKTNGGLFLNQLRRELIEYLHPKPLEEPPAPPTLLEFIDQFIKTSNKSPRTKLSYGTTRNILERYAKTMPGGLGFQDINMDFYNSFQRYCFKKENKALNTFGDHIKKIKVFMNAANDRGVTNNQGHLHRNFKTLEETSDSIYLTDQEITILYNLNLSENPKYERVRDLFIIGCHTGLRFSDLAQLKPSNIVRMGTVLKIKTAKTGEMVEVPLHWTVREILKKYGGNPPRAISNQKMNLYIKEIAQKEEAKLNENTSKAITRGGLRYEKTRAKWELVTVHTARRSFATNMFLDGFPTLSIMKVTGHRTEKAFLKYIKITGEQNAVKMMKHQRFAEKPTLTATR